MACKESRAETLKYYQNKLPSVAGNGSEIRFHPDDAIEIEDLSRLVDTSGANILEICNLESMAADLANIKTLVLIRRPLGGDECVMNTLLQQGVFDKFMSIFSGLKRVVLIYDHEQAATSRPLA